MKAIETVSNNPTAVVRRKAHSPYQYRKVLDGRKQPIRGLWERNGKFVARLAIEEDNGMKRTQWVPLEGVETVPQAQAKLAELHTDRARNVLPILKQTPKLADYALKTYFPHFAAVTDAKRPATIAKEKGALTGGLSIAAVSGWTSSAKRTSPASLPSGRRRAYPAGRSIWT